MKYPVEENIKVFLSVLFPTDNSAGAGTASVVAGAMAAAMRQSTEISRSHAENRRRKLGLGRQLEGHSNVNAASDLECAVYLALPGLKGCSVKVAINLPSLKDRVQADRMKVRADELKRSS